jgi:arginase
VLGPRDQELRRKYNVASLADRDIHLRRHDAVADDPAGVARKAVEHVRKTAPSWWLHTDLDVIAEDIFTAGQVPGDEDMEGGLDWAQLTELTVAAFAGGGCAGWSIVIYDPEQDDDGSQARRIVEFVSAVSSSLPVAP